MYRTDVLIIGAGQAGLALSRCLVERSIDHVLLERGRVAESWRSQRWDSLRLLTPRWQARLPHWSYRGPDPDGFMTMPEITDYLVRYAAAFCAPVHDDCAVLSVRRQDGGYRVTSTRGTWQARTVVVATGACSTPSIPDFGSQLSARIQQLVPTRYRNPGQLEPGGVLVVGASASGLQIADELRRSGRDVVLSVGRHTRIPRRYRGHDIMWWLDRLGILGQTVDEIRDVARARRSPSFQLVGRPDHADLDLRRLAADGVTLVGRAMAADDARVRFAPDLAHDLGHADRKLDRLLGRINAGIATLGLPAEPVHRRPEPTGWVPAGPSTLDLADRQIRTVVWATGFRPHYPWLQVPVLDGRGELLHRGGLTPSPGLYAIGLPVLRRRNSTYIDGVGLDAAEIARDIDHRLARAIAA